MIQSEMNERELRVFRSIGDSLRAIQQDVHAIHEQHSAHSDQTKPPTQVDIQSEIRLPPAIVDYYRSENSEGPHARRRDRVRLIVEGVGLIAAVVAGVFAYRTFHQVRRQADYAQTQAVTMQRQMRLDQRAWIVTKYPTIPLADGKPLTVPLIMENLGKTIGRHISGVVAVYVLKAGADPDLSYAPGHTHYDFGPTGIFIPNTPAVTNWIAMREGRQIVLTAPMHQAILAGELLVTIHGKIDYEDVFGDHHWFTFCQETGGGAMQASASDKCAAYNDTDDQENAKK